MKAAIVPLAAAYHFKSSAMSTHRR
jgi:hypothetical protein